MLVMHNYFFFFWGFFPIFFFRKVYKVKYVSLIYEEDMFILQKGI